MSHGRTGVAVFKDDFQTIRPLAERDNANTSTGPEFERGGHYAAPEVPELVVGDLRTFFGWSRARAWRVRISGRATLSVGSAQDEGVRLGVEVDLHRAAVADLAGQQGLGQPVADLLLYQPSSGRAP